MIMKNERNNKTLNILEKPVFKAILTVYIIAVSAFICYQTSKVYYELLWSNERVAVVIFMTVSILLPYFYMLYKKENIIKTVILYHFIIIATALIMILPYEFRPYLLVLLIVSMVTNLETGVITNGAICGFGFFSLASEPEFFFTIIMLLTGILGCLVVTSKRKNLTKYIGLICIIVFNMFLNAIFRIYCKDAYLEYEKASYIFVGAVGCIISCIVYVIIKYLFEKFVLKKATRSVLKAMTKEEFPPLKELKTKAISTYYHCVQVAELSKACAKAIGVNEDIAYVGGLYHEIGKISGREYVKDGVIYAKKHSFPPEIIDIIANHNIKYGVAKNKECAIVLIADTCISAYNYYKAKEGDSIRAKDIYEKAVVQRLMSGYLDKSKLSIDEFRKILKLITTDREMENGN